MAEFFMVVCKKPLPLSRHFKFQVRQMERLMFRLMKKEEKKDLSQYVYLGTTDFPEDELSPSLWQDACDGAVAFETLDEAEIAAFNVCAAFPHLIGRVEILKYGI